MAAGVGTTRPGVRYAPRLRCPETDVPLPPSPRVRFRPRQHDQRKVTMIIWLSIPLSVSTSEAAKGGPIADKVKSKVDQKLGKRR